MENAHSPERPVPDAPAGVASGSREILGGAFGKILVERGLCSEADLERCLAIQAQRAKGGDFVRLGAVLVEEGLLTPPQVAEVLQEQAITVLVCEACGAQYNVRRYVPIKTYECRRCHARLVPLPGKLESVAVQDAVEDPRGTARRPVRGPQFETDSAAGLDATATARIRQRRRLGRYEILGEIARGGMGVIYKARQIDLERVVALKTLRTDESRRGDGPERFRREARALAGLRHPNVVAVHEVGEIEGIPYFTMEFIEGLPLDRRIMKSALPPEQAVDILAPIAEALHYCHGEGVVHRDLKPANILIDSHGAPFLVDFGIAMRKGERGPDLDDKDELIGSIPYMAKEYVDGSAYDEKCDLYSLGVVLYEALAGHEVFPFFDRSTTRLLEKISDATPVEIRDRLPALDADLSAVVMKAIARDREKRYATAGAFAADLRAWRRGEPVLANPRSKVALAAREVARQAPPALALALAFTTVLFAGLYVRREHARAIAERELDVMKAELDAASLDRDSEVCRTLLDEARVLAEIRESTRAIGVLSNAIERFGGRGTNLPLLADAFELRARLRKGRGDPGWEQDVSLAAELRKKK
ncbi:protein kinase [bacterium]|nr:protein kinase [bacterium]